MADSVATDYSLLYQITLSTSFIKYSFSLLVHVHCYYDGTIKTIVCVDQSRGNLFVVQAFTYAQINYVVVKQYC